MGGAVEGAIAVLEGALVHERSPGYHPPASAALFLSILGTIFTISRHRRPSMADEPGRQPLRGVNYR